MWPTSFPCLFLLNATPSKQGSKLDKKGFCEDTLTKQAHFSQEKLTGLGQQILTNLCNVIIFN